MTPKQSTARLTIYVMIAMLGAASAGIDVVDFSDIKQVSKYAISVILVGLITGRSYIDQSPTQVEKP